MLYISGWFVLEATLADERVVDLFPDHGHVTAKHSKLASDMKSKPEGLLTYKFKVCLCSLFLAVYSRFAFGFFFFFFFLFVFFFFFFVCHYSPSCSFIFGVLWFGNFLGSPRAQRTIHPS
jgi:hypothetical protein